MNRWTLGLLVTLVGGSAIGCGDDDKGDGDSGADKCEEAAKILKDCGGETNEVAECNAEAQAEADCVIKHPKGACSEDLDDPESEAFFDCLFGG